MQVHEVGIEIGGTPLVVRTASDSFRRTLQQRYAPFLQAPTGGKSATGNLAIDVELLPSHPAESVNSEDLEVQLEDGKWCMRRGDFFAQWDPRTGQGRVRQSENPYSIDCVLRIVHSLMLAKNGGVLVHAASAIRNGKAFLFAGVSGAGKTTMSRLAPPDATLLTDEISYVRPVAGVYHAFGTPFAGELAKLGTQCSAPLESVFLLAQGPHNRIDDIEQTVAVQALLRNILFFAHDQVLVEDVFTTACNLAQKVSVRRLTFRPEQNVWDLIG